MPPQCLQKREPAFPPRVADCLLLRDVSSSRKAEVGAVRREWWLARQNCLKGYSQQPLCKAACLGCNPEENPKRSSWSGLSLCVELLSLLLPPPSFPTEVSFPIPTSHSGSPVSPQPTHLSPFDGLRQAGHVRKFLGVHFNKT